MSKEINKEIADREYAIRMYGYDIWGNSANSNSQKMKRLNLEISNLRKYGKANPSFLTKIFHRKIFP